MRLIVPLIAVTALLGACDGPASSTRATSAAADIAMVERAQQMPAPRQPVTPEPVSFADADVPGREITMPQAIPKPRAGEGCGFFAVARPRHAVLVAVPQFGLVRHDGEWETFAADSGSARVSGDLPARYSSTGHILQLADAVDGPDRLTITDKYGRVVYASEGELRCKT